MLKINPFTPNSPAPIGIFVGRHFELDTFNKALSQTENSNPTHLLLLGERGIGKTSLLNAAQLFATGKFDWDGQKHNFLTVKISLSESLCLADFAINLKSLIEREIAKENIGIEFIKKTWKFLSRFEVNGISYKREESKNNNDQLIQEFIFSLVDTVKFLRSSSTLIKKEGLVVLIDETDKASKDLHLGSFLKNLSETLISEGQNNILFILTGLPSAKDILIQSHESSLRLFQELNLSPLSKEETKEVIERGLTYSEEKNGQKITINDEALNLINIFSEGYPHFIQQIGSSVFDIDSDNNISKEDVESGFFMEHGALEQIGERYYSKQFYTDIKVESYREILNIMAKKQNNWVTREEIKKEFSGKVSTLNHGISALIDKGTIIPKEGVRGQYKLQWASFALWIQFHDKTKRRN